jgi:hypothetical protein
MGFIVGFLTGLLAAIGLLGFLAYWLCTRSNHIAIAKAVNGLANALATKPKSLQRLTAAGDNTAVEEPGGRQGSGRAGDKAMDW